MLAPDLVDEYGFACCDIGHAVFFLRKGYKMARKNWNGKHFIKLVPDARPESGETNLVIGPPDPIFREWIPSNDDLLASDWMIVWEI